MAFNDVEQSVAGAQPIELYEFQSTKTTWRFTSSATEITSAGDVYTPVAGLVRNQVKSGTQEEENIALDISLPFNNPMVKAFAYKIAPPSLELTLRRTHAVDTNDVVVMWKGQVMSFSVTGRVAKLRVPAIFSYILNGIAPRPQYMAPCNHVLYDGRCAVAPTSHQEIVTVIAQEANVVTVTGLTMTASEILGGEIVSGTERRMVVGLTSQDISISYPFAELPNGTNVTVRKGCDHSFATCKAKFNNGINFGGFPLVPDRNPFSSKI